MSSRVLACLTLGVSLGAAVGIGAYTFVYARGGSYLSDDPKTCANCHVMRSYYDDWIKSSHAAVADCNDCHAPRDLLHRYSDKVWNGFWHSLAFTTGGFHEPIRIQPHSASTIEEACRTCHVEIVEAMGGLETTGESRSCLRCPGSVGHFR